MKENNPSDPQPKGMPEIQAVQDAGIAAVSKKIIIWTLIAIAVVLAVGGGIYWLHKSGENKANEAIAAADIEMNDSIKYVMYKKLADDGSYKANERAKLMVAIKYYQDGKYQDAIKYLDDASVDSPIIEAGALSLEGDCYANLGKNDEALKYFNKALDAADDNPQLVPYLLVKIANVYRAQKNYEKEYEAYVSIRTEYPGYMPDIDKYIERARIAAGK